MSLRGILDANVHATEVKALHGMITGSDEEAASVKAVRVAFPNSRQLYCVLRCQDNVRDYMTKTGIPQKVREEIIRMLFGTNSLALSPDEATFEDARAGVMQYARQYCAGIEEYLATRIIPKLLKNCFELVLPFLCVNNGII